jgi:hypothetical protein
VRAIDGDPIPAAGAYVKREVQQPADLLETLPDAYLAWSEWMEGHFA